MDKSNPFMSRALTLAQQAYAEDEIPVGAVITDPTGTIVGEGYNQNRQKTQSAHAEIIALRQAEQNSGDWRLNECTLYVTLEPCLMCLGFAHLARISHLVFATHSPLFGFRNHIKEDANLINIIQLSSDDPQAIASVELLQKFFQEKRNKF